MLLLIALQSLPSWARLYLHRPTSGLHANSQYVKSSEIYSEKRFQHKMFKVVKTICYTEVLFRGAVEGRVSEAHCRKLLPAFFWPPTQLSSRRLQCHWVQTDRGWQRGSALICSHSYTILKLLIPLYKAWAGLWIIQKQSPLLCCTVLSLQIHIWLSAA